MPSINMTSKLCAPYTVPMKHRNDDDNDDNVDDDKIIMIILVIAFGSNFVNGDEGVYGCVRSFSAGD